MARSQASAATVQSRVLLSTEETATLLNCHKVTLWRWMKTIPDFPMPIRISPGRVAFIEREVLHYIKTRPRAEPNR